MKNKRNGISCLILLLAGVTHFPVQAQQKNGAQDVVHQLDIKKSKLFWKAPKNRHRGFILFKMGTLSNVTVGSPTRGTFSINMNSMRNTDEGSDTHRKGVDDKLRSEGFFAVSKYPTAAMVVKQILPSQNPTTYKVSGELTIKGVTNPIEFTAIMKQNGNTVIATANTIISREKWNIDHQPQSWDFLARVEDNLLEDEISVTLQLVFSKKQL